MKTNIKISIIMLLLLPSLLGKAEKGKFHLFSEQTRRAYPSAIYDFLERYLYELDSLHHVNPIIQPRLKNDKVFFMKGTPETARQITPSTPFTVRITENKYYEAIWSDSLQEEVLHIVFPINYELILGMPKHLIEKTIKKQLMNMPTDFITDSLPTHETMIKLEDGYYRPTHIQHLDDIESLHTGTYYKLSGDKTLQPLFCNSEKMYSAANLLQGIIANCTNYKMYIYQQLYDFKKEEYLITLTQWLNYCKLIHAIIYIGLEEEREDGLKVLLIAHSYELGFQHMMSIIFPWNFIEKQNAVIKASFNAFIPIHNVKSMYMEKVK